MNKVITIKAWRRPDYYQQVISALEKCPGIDDYIIYTVVDHTDPQYGFLSKHTYIGNKSRLNIFTIPAQTPLGCAGATRMCLEVGFNGTDNDFIIHLEDDTVPSRDFIKFMEFSDRVYKENPEVFVVHAHNRHPEWPEGDKEDLLSQVSLRKGITTYWGWGIWRRLWDEMKDNFFGIHWVTGDEPEPILEGEEFLKQIVYADDGSWGWPMLKYWPKGRKEVFPVISRIQNIGKERGRFCVDQDIYYNRHHTPVWAEDHVPDKYKRV